MKILIIDGENLRHRAMHAYKGLTNNVKPVSIIYGMIQITSHLIKQFTPDKVFVCWDAGRHTKRLKLHPEYKSKRKSYLISDEEKAAIQLQREKTMQLYNALGVYQVMGPGMEADDWIYILSRKYKKHRITIVSADKDFHQLLSNKLKIWNPMKQLLIGKHNVKAHYGYSHTECIDYLSLVGDDSDNIKGYYGMGEETTKKFLAEHGSIKNFLENEELEFRKIDRVKLYEVYKRNRILIGLKAFYLRYLKGTKPNYYHNQTLLGTTPGFDKKVLWKIFDEYNIQAFRKPEFLKTFKDLPNTYGE